MRVTSIGRAAFQAGPKAVARDLRIEDTPKDGVALTEPPQRDTFVFVLNSSGETNMCRPLIAELKKQGYQVKVVHFRPQARDILVGEGILDERDLIDGTSSFLHLPRVGQILRNELDPSRVVKLVGTPHHVYSQFAFAEAKDLGLPTLALIDLGIPDTRFRFRHTFYRTLTQADDAGYQNGSQKQLR